MTMKLPENDPIAAFQRKATAARRVGAGAQCACGEARPEALITGSDPIICAACQRAQQGKTTMDEHHFAGKTNSPVTVPAPVNDHQAELTPAQLDWPKETRENPDGSPLLAAAGCVRGFVDWVVYLMKKGLLWVAEMLETLNAFLVDKFGPKWWVGTPLARFAPAQC